MKSFIGIDPGQKGALAVVGADISPAAWDWPGTPQVARETLLSVALDTDVRLVAIEAQQVMRKQGQRQGAGSAFTIGENFGLWQGLVAGLGLPYVIVRPREWQKGFFRKADRKNPAMAVASRMFPQVELYGPRGGKKDGRADALLIADWAMRRGGA